MRCAFETRTRRSKMAPLTPLRMKHLALSVALVSSYVVAFPAGSRRFVSRETEVIGGAAPTTTSDPATVGPVFCNRELNLRQLDVVGFDMDHTLAQYETAFDLLAFEGAKDKLHTEYGYPEEVLDFHYDASTYSRGLIIDKARGNFLKIDRHKYVRVASHGSKVLSSQERKEIYRPNFEGTLEFKGSNFVKMDTLFHVVDASLFAQLVDLKDRKPELFKGIDYPTIYQHVRACVDLCHRDGTIKKEVARDPVPYIVRDPNLIPMLRAFKAAGKKVFLLTNSHWEYTDVVMNFLWGNPPDAPDLQWTDLFDVIICGAKKPHFLTDPYLNLFRVNVEDGTLQNTDGVDDDYEAFLAEGKVFQGGNYRDLHKMVGLTSGERLLYVGDHMFSDVLRTKRSLGWRTCLIIPELEHEIKVLDSLVGLRQDIRRLREEQRILDMEANEAVTASGLNGEDLEPLLQQLDEKQGGKKEELSEVTRTYHQSFHPTWGQLFKAGYQSSQFAKQVEGYACLYTSKASNLVACALRHFRPAIDEVPHESAAAS